MWLNYSVERMQETQRALTKSDFPMECSRTCPEVNHGAEEAAPSDCIRFESQIFLPPVLPRTFPTDARRENRPHCFQSK